MSNARRGATASIMASAMRDALPEPMRGYRRLCWLVAALCASLVAWSPSSIAREPPAAGCVDLGALSGGWRTGEREILIRSSGQAGVRLQLDTACPVFEQGVDLVASGADGWACPGRPASVRGGDIICPVTRTIALSDAEVTEALVVRDATLQAAVPLDRVVVRGHRWRDIRGTTDYCVDARYLRGWREDRDGLVVEVSPRRHAGHRYYHVELVNDCADLASAHAIRLVARSGGAAVCGHPGDKVLLVAASTDLATPMGGARIGAFGRGCEISKVTPFPRK